MKYQEVSPITRHDAEIAFSSGNPDSICDALVSITFYDSDWRWVQDWCIHFSNHPVNYVRGLAANCFGHLARIHGCLEKEKVIAILQKLLDDPEVCGRAEEALEDIKMFLSD